MYDDDGENEGNDNLLSPKAVDDLLSREMMQLSVQDRNDIQEEIHGVRCLAPEETPQMVATALRMLSVQLDQIIPVEQKRSYLLARQLQEQSYVNTPEFRLRFIRCCLFDTRSAARRICTFLNEIHKLFGGFALRRELNFYKDFTKDEIREFRKGRYQFLPFRDRSGRRILIIFPDEELEKMDPSVRLKFLIYLTIVAAKDDTETQRNGIVVLVWLASTYKNSYKTPTRRPDMRYLSWCCIRVSAIHVCTPDTPAYRFKRSIMAMRINHQSRSRLKLHVGTSIELKYILQGYGIPTEKIPMTWSGTVKIVYLKNWIKLRKSMEDVTLLSSVSNIVECPNLNDVIFRKGTSLYCHPGNARFRSLVEQKVCAYDPASYTTAVIGTPTKDLISEIIDDIVTKRNGRVLVWINNCNDDKFGCWCTITDESQIYSKIEYIVRDFIRNSVATKQEKNLQTNESSTSIFQSSSSSNDDMCCHKPEII